MWSEGRWSTDRPPKWEILAEQLDWSRSKEGKKRGEMFGGGNGRCLPVGVKTADEAADSVPPGVTDRVSAETVTVTMPTVSVLTMVEAGASAAVTVT